MKAKEVEKGGPVTHTTGEADTLTALSLTQL